MKKAEEKKTDRGSKVAGKGAKDKAWTVKPGNYTSIAAITAGHAKKEKLVQDQSKSMLERKERYLAQIEKLQTDVAGLEDKLATMTVPDWVVGIVEPLTKELQRALPGIKSAIVPVGESVAISLTIGAGTSEEEVRSITLVPVDLAKGKIAYRDFTAKNTRKYRPGSVQALTGANFPAITLSDSVTVRELVQYLR